MITFQTAVIPAAGLGTRFLPVTKSVPKELLPLVDRPCIEVVAEEAAKAGAQRLVIVTSPGKDCVAAYFASDPELEATLTRRGKSELLRKVRRAGALLEVQAVIQPRPIGLGDAVLRAEAALADDETSVAVLLPDDVVLPRGVLDTMARVQRRRGGSVLCPLRCRGVR